MLVNVVRVVLRYLLRNRIFAALNISGLSLGLACCVVIFLFVRNELSYDRFHADADKIYRVLRQSQINSMPYNIGVTSAPYAAALKEDFDGRVESVTRTFSFNALVRSGDKAFLEERLMLADKNFFGFFSFPLLKGDASRVLTDPNSIVISSAFANKYFGSEDPIGKMIRVDDQYDMVVTGVMDEVPGNTHLQFEVVGSMSILEGEDWFNDWWGNAFNTYIQTEPEHATFLNKSFPAFMDKYFGKDFERVGNRIGLKLEPLKEIYFNYDTRYENNIAHGDERYVYVFATTGILLILLAAINYINLATAQATQRAKEVGVRKTLGSTQRRLVMQFLSESFLLCVVSMTLAVVMAQASIPFFNSTFGISIPDISKDRWLWPFLGAVLLFITLVAGAYPSFVLSSFRPVRVLRGQLKTGMEYLFVRKTLVVFQFGISAFMIIATLFISYQLKYVHEKDLGYDAEQLVVVRLNNGLILEKREAFREELLRQGKFTNASYTSGHPGGFYDASTVQIQGQEENIRMRTLWADENLAETMDMQLVTGRYFSESFPADSINSVVLNETAVRQIGWTNEAAIGKRIMLAQFDSTYKEVVGVVKDYHFASLKEKIEPLIISYINRRGNLLLRIPSGEVQSSIAALEKSWASQSTGFPLDFVFLDDVMGRLYSAEQVQGKVFTIFSAISVAIACLGILGLTSYIASQRRKEIGIRKVLGATAGQVSFLLMKDLLRLVLVANLLAIPAGYWVVNEWLTGFAYRINLHPLVFITGAMSVFVIAMLIVGINASRVAMQNPVKSLRVE